MSEGQVNSLEICITSGRKFMHKQDEVLSDAEIVSLFLARDEAAITAVNLKYRDYCWTIAKSILKNQQDAEECLNDTWLKAWESIPPNEPQNLGAFLATITKNICINRYDNSHAKKRGKGELPAVLEELSECTASRNNVEKEFEHKLLVEAINEFLGTLPRDKRDIFVLRYWYCLSTGEIAKRVGAVNRGSVSVTLLRTRRALAKFLEKRGFLDD